MKMRGVVVAAVSALLVGCGSRTGGSSNVAQDAEPSGEGTQREVKVDLPAYPQDRDLIEFFPGPRDSHRYFIDGKTLSMGKDGVVRYSVVIRTSGGATNVSYEGLRCSSGERRTYAFGNRDKTWVEAKRSDWEPIRPGLVNEYSKILYSEYFCPDRAVLPDRETALRALRTGRRESDLRGNHL